MIKQTGTAGRPYAPDRCQQCGEPEHGTAGCRSVTRFLRPSIGEVTFLDRSGVRGVTVTLSEEGR